MLDQKTALENNPEAETRSSRHAHDQVVPGTHETITYFHSGEDKYYTTIRIWKTLSCGPVVMKLTPWVVAIVS